MFKKLVESIEKGNYQANHTYTFNAILNKYRPLQVLRKLINKHSQDLSFQASWFLPLNYKIKGNKLELITYECPYFELANISFHDGFEDRNYKILKKENISSHIVVLDSDLYSEGVYKLKLKYHIHTYLIEEIEDMSEYLDIILEKTLLGAYGNYVVDDLNAFDYRRAILYKWLNIRE